MTTSPSDLPPYRDDLERLLDYGRVIKARAAAARLRHELEADVDSLVEPRERLSAEQRALTASRLQDLERVEAEAFGVIELRGATGPESRLDQLARKNDLDHLEHEILLTLAAAAIDPSVDDALTQASPWQAPRGHDVAGLAQVVAPDQLQRQLDVLVRLGPDARLVKAGLVRVDRVRGDDEAHRLWCRDVVLSASGFAAVFGTNVGLER